MRHLSERSDNRSYLDVLLLNYIKYNSKKLIFSEMVYLFKMNYISVERRISLLLEKGYIVEKDYKIQLTSKGSEILRDNRLSDFDFFKKQAIVIENLKDKVEEDGDVNKISLPKNFISKL